jgi:ribokinase
MTDMIAYSERLPGAGETVAGDRFSLGFGGKGANQAVMSALLGASVHFIGSLGDDVFGRMTLENLTSFGIDVTHVRFTDQAPTGAAPIWVDHSGENRIIVIPGANELLDPDLVASAVTELEADVVLVQFEVPGQCVEAALDAANAAGSVSVINPAPMRPVAKGLFGSATWVIPNEPELRLIGELFEIRDAGSVGQLVHACANAAGTSMAVTVGAGGAFVCDCRDERSTVVPVSAPRADVIDTTGAGDAFVGAFAYGLAVGANPVDAARFACHCASASVEAPGTQTSFPRPERLVGIKRRLLPQLTKATADASDTASEMEDHA